VKRSAWTDERLDDKMGGIDSTFEMLRDEMQGMRRDLREELQGLRTEIRAETQGLRGEMRELRHDFTALQTTLVQIGFGMVGVLLAAMVALIVALA
jgi:ribosomal protein L29